MSQTFMWQDSRLIQFNNSATLNAILQGLNDMLGIAAEEFINGILNVDTAVGAQLDVIGRLVGVSRQVNFPVLYGQDSFGFDSNSFYGFDEFGGTFDIDENTDVYTLNDEAYRTYILAKAFSNISNTSLGSLNHLLGAIFRGRGLCYVRQTGNTEISFFFGFNLKPFEINLLQNNYIPIPAGYSSKIVFLQGA